MSTNRASTRSKRKASTSDHVKHEATGWATIILGGLALFILAPAILGGLGGAVVSAVPKAADAATCWPTAPVCPPERVRPSTTPTTTAAPQMTEKELQARMQAKQLGDGLAAARIVPAAPPESDGGYWPRLGEAPGGGVLGELPVVGGAIQGALKALGPGGVKALNP